MPKPLIDPHEQFYGLFDDMKLRMALAAVSDKYNEYVRQVIYRTYTDIELGAMYERIRQMGIYERGSRTGARHRKIIEIPNEWVMRFLDQVMGALYGDNWIQNEAALKHELVRPWWVVRKL